MIIIKGTSPVKNATSGLVFGAGAYSMTVFVDNATSSIKLSKLSLLCGMFVRK